MCIRNNLHDQSDYNFHYSLPITITLKHVMFTIFYYYDYHTLLSMLHSDCNHTLQNNIVLITNLLVSTVARLKTEVIEIVIVIDSQVIVLVIVIYNLNVEVIVIVIVIDLK